MRLNLAIAALALAALLPTAVLAQDAAPAAGTPTPSASGSGTVTDSKQVGDWTVRCFAVTSPSPCDMYQELQDQTSHQRVLSVSIAYVPSNDKHVMQIAVPLGVALQKGVVIKTDSYVSPALPYRRCDQAGCYVEMLLGDDQVAGFVKSGPQASVNIVADDNKPYALRFSLNGFAGAHDAMAGLARQKAVGTAPGAPEQAAPAAAPAKAKKR
jgi:invasion protein IalB